MAIGILAEAELARRFGEMAIRAGMEARAKTSIIDATLEALTNGESEYSLTYTDHRSGSTVVITSYYPIRKCCNFWYSILTRQESGDVHGAAVFMPHDETEWDCMINMLAKHFSFDII